MARTHGENVSLEFVSSDASAAAAMTIKDANMATRVLAANERMVIDGLEANVVTGITADVFVDINADGNLTAGELIASFTLNATLDVSDKEGISLPLGLGPSVKATGSGAMKITGSGRIFATAVVTRPTWQARLNS